MDQGSVLVARAKMECSNLSPSDVGHDPTCALCPARYSPEMSRRPILVLIPDPLESASIFHRTSPIASGSGISPNHYRQYINVC